MDGTDEMVDRLLQHYGEAVESELAEPGRAWYRGARREARRISRDHCVTLSVAAGMLAAYSPRVRWQTNLRLAEETARDGQPTTGNMRRSRESALRILDGERPLVVLRGPKTRAFYRAIMGDHDAAVLDVWMLRAMGVDKPPSAARYLELSEVLREAARRAGESTATFQAVVWTRVRGRAG